MFSSTAPDTNSGPKITKPILQPVKTTRKSRSRKGGANFAFPDPGAVSRARYRSSRRGGLDFRQRNDHDLALLRHRRRAVHHSDPAGALVVLLVECVLGSAR